MEMKINLGVEGAGLAHFFKPWEILAWDVVWNAPVPLGAGDVWRKVSKALGDSTISRASIIFFLNRQVALEFMDWKDATGKGGHHRLYWALVTMESLVQAIIDVTEDVLYALKTQAENYDRMNREGPGLVYRGGVDD